VIEDGRGILSGDQHKFHICTCGPSTFTVHPNIDGDEMPSAPYSHSNPIRTLTGTPFASNKVILHLR
jgi:hypothetical protein